MYIQILQISPTKDTNIRALEAEFEKRLGPFCKLETLTLKDEAALRTKLNTDALKLALHPDAGQMDSLEFANFLRETRDFGPGKLQILIGGPEGHSPELLAEADRQLSFSKMTFTHEMIRVFLKEQLYRAFCILAGKPYHK